MLGYLLKSLLFFAIPHLRVPEREGGQSPSGAARNHPELLEKNLQKEDSADNCTSGSFGMAVF